MKLGRTYIMTIQIDDAGVANNTVVVKFPMTLKFNINRGVQASSNLGHFQVYNLAENTRKKIFHDRTDVTHYRQVTLLAGYEDEKKLSLIFKGNMFQAFSYRQGADWITEIEAYSGLYAIENAQASLSIGAGYDVKKLIAQVVNGMTQYGVALGKIGNIEAGQNSRAIALSGSSWDILQQLGNGNDVFIDNENINVIGKNEYVDPPDGLSLINSDTGLLQSIRRYEGRFDVPILFEPRIQVGQKVQIQSAETIFNGIRKVSGVIHRGTISGAVGEDCQTMLTVWTGTEVLRAA